MSVRIMLPLLDLRSETWGWTSFLIAPSPHWTANQDVILDLGKCGFLSADGSAVLTAFALKRRNWGATTRLDHPTVPPDLRKQLGRWRLAELFRLDNPPWTDNAIPLFHQTRLDSKVRILANDAYYSTAGGAPDIRTLPVAYPGTLFQVRLNVRDDVHYTFGAR
jgi:hypothetical protein